ncbi:SUMF1/EgtB/PvdO family nonheme iron enzyme [bacterium]|nr:SUMF1/EgtB/PvdO family nonheme iron enzyme [bacterium]
MAKILIFEAIVEGKRYFCIDRYEYPNKNNLQPTASVSYYEAVNSCLENKKRLCTTIEWQTACQGEGNMNYSYGNEYIEGKCNTDKGWTNRSEALPSGSFGGCHNSGWDDSGELYDMIGNTAEWTQTKAGGSCQYVKGGYWAYGNKANCGTGVCLNPNYKLFFIGFRCCSK